MSSGGLLDVIAASGDLKSLSGKVPTKMYDRFVKACEHLGLNKNRAVAGAISQGLDILEAEAAKVPPKTKKAKKGAAAAAATAATTPAAAVFG